MSASDTSLIERLRDVRVNNPFAGHADLCDKAADAIDTLERELAAAIEQRDKAREDALEQAAKVCDELRTKDYSSEDERWVAGTDDCAAAIRRAMKECGNE